MNTLASNTRRNVILIIEDDVRMRQFLIENLTDAGFETVQAENGAQGLKSAQEMGPDLILLDNRMPEMTGYAMLRRLRESSAWGEQVPVIFFSNIEASTKEERNDIASAGAAYYLLKVNTSMEELIAKIREILKISK
jgi:two-component system OmpR family response regulator